MLAHLGVMLAYLEGVFGGRACSPSLLCETRDAVRLYATAHLGWAYVGPTLRRGWPILGLCWGYLEGNLGPYLGAMLAHLEAYVGPC